MIKIIPTFRAKIMQSMPTCEKVARLKSESMDSHLNLRQHLAIKSHFLFCQWCRKYGKQLDMIRHAARKLKVEADNFEDKPSPKLSSGTKERLRNLLKD